MFLFRASRFLEELKKHDPDIYDTCVLTLERSEQTADTVDLRRCHLRLLPGQLHRLRGDGKNPACLRRAAECRLERRRLLVLAVGGQR